MTGIFQAVIDDIDARIDRLKALRDGLIAESATGMPGKVAAAKPGRTWTTGRAKAGGSDDVIAEVVFKGADTMKAIVAASKMKPHVAKHAVRRLVASGRIRTEGATVSLRYLPGKNK